MEQLSVLHIWNTAGVASTIAKYQRKILGWNTWVIMRKEHDTYGHTVYGELLDVGVFHFYVKALAHSRKYTIIHVHDIDKLVPMIKTLYPRKPVILHYHGDTIRGKWQVKQRYWSKADVVLVATRDLLEDAPKNATIHYAPNPVDTELFKPMEGLRRKNTALYITDSRDPRYQQRLSHARRIASTYNLRLEIHDRAVKPVRYTDMPLLLNRYEYYIDHAWVPALSKTALEALACGLKVFRWDNKLVERLPDEHRPENVVHMLEKLYRELLE